MSIEDTTGTLAAFANAGLIGSDAGTSFKTMLLAIQNPAGKTQDMMDELGISAYDAQGQFIGITKFAGQLQEKLKNLTPQARAQAMAQMFGNDAVRAGVDPVRAGRDGHPGWIDKTNDAGYAAETASKLTDNLAGDVERLKGSLETMAIEAGSGANSGLRVLTKSVNGLVDQFGALPPYVGSAVTVLAGIGGALLLGGVAWVKYRRAVSSTLEELRATGPAGEKAAAGLEKARGAAAKAMIGFVALEGAAAILNSFGPEAANVDRLTASLTNLANTGQVAGEAADRFGTDLHGINDDAAVATSGVAKWLDKVEGFIPIAGDAMRAATALGARIAGKDDYQTALQNYASLDTSMTDFMNTTNDVRKAGDLWNQVLVKSGLDADQLIRLLPNAYKRLQDMQAAAHGAAGGQTALGSATGKATGKLGEEKDAAKATAEQVKSLSDELHAQVDPAFALINAQNKLRKAQTDAADAVKRHGRNSVEARTATQNLTNAAIDLRVNASALGRTFDTRVTPDLYATLKAAGLTESQIRDVGRQFSSAKKAADKYDGTYTANVKITGDKPVAAKFQALSSMQRALKGGTTIPMQARRAFAFAEGGWTGPGATHDEAGVVHADEFVIRKSSRRKIEQRHPGLLDEMNEKGAIPGYAGGGRVTWPFPTTAAMTRVPSRQEAANAVIPAAPSGGATWQWIVAVVRQAFPGLHAISTFRPGAVTLTGNRSYHAVGRAVDWPPSRALAEWVNLHYKARTRELITPWNSLNIWNGRRHTYTGPVFRQHNFAGGNAHDHWAMRQGGTIREPIIGVGASGRTYSFGENYMPERVIPNYRPEGAGGGGGGAQITVQFSGPVGSRYELEQWLTGAFDNLKRKGKV
jgi:hypothetical protein